MAGQVLLSISKDEIERARLDSEYKFAVDLQSKIVDAKRAERREIAINALKEGATASFVTKITGLDDSTIHDLQAEMGS